MRVWLHNVTEPGYNFAKRSQTSPGQCCMPEIQYAYTVMTTLFIFCKNLGRHKRKSSGPSLRENSYDRKPQQSQSALAISAQHRSIQLKSYLQRHIDSHKESWHPADCSNIFLSIAPFRILRETPRLLRRAASIFGSQHNVVFAILLWVP